MLIAALGCLGGGQLRLLARISTLRGWNLAGMAGVLFSHGVVDRVALGPNEVGGAPSSLGLRIALVTILLTNFSQLILLSHHHSFLVVVLLLLRHLLKPVMLEGHLVVGFRGEDHLHLGGKSFDVEVFYSHSLFSRVGLFVVDGLSRYCCLESRAEPQELLLRPLAQLVTF